MTNFEIIDTGFIMIFETGIKITIKPLTFDTKVDQIIQRTHDVKSFRFKRPDNFNYLPGQWVYVNIKVNDTTKRHHFTLSSSPTEEFLEFTKKITDSSYSQALNSFRGGEWARIDGPYGEFTYSGENIKIGALTGGIGITPLRSICKYISDNKLQTSVKMLYANHTEKDIVFRDQFDEMHKISPNIEVKNVLTREPEWKELKGHIDPKMIEEQIPDYKDRDFYICGPPGMVATMQKVLKDLRLPDSQIRIENFTGY